MEMIINVKEKLINLYRECFCCRFNTQADKITSMVNIKDFWLLLVQITFLAPFTMLQVSDVKLSLLLNGIPYFCSFLGAACGSPYIVFISTSGM